MFLTSLLCACAAAAADGPAAAAAAHDELPPPAPKRRLGLRLQFAGRLGRPIARPQRPGHGRVWKKSVQYDVRKNFADTRLRVKGRFVKKEDEGGCSGSEMKPRLNRA